VFELFRSHRESHGSLCMFFLETCFTRHASALCSFLRPDHVSDLFASTGDDLRAGVLLWRVLKAKHRDMAESGEPEVRKLLKILERRYDTRDLRRVPPCGLRYALVKILLDVVPARRALVASASSGLAGHPGHPGTQIIGATQIIGSAALAQQPTSRTNLAATLESANLLILDYCLHWLGDTGEPAELKAPVLELLRAVVKASSSTLATTHIVTLFFALLMRRGGGGGGAGKNAKAASDGGGGVGHPPESSGSVPCASDDVQFALSLVDWSELGKLLPAVFGAFSDEKLVTLWTFVVLMVPAALPDALLAGAAGTAWRFDYCGDGGVGGGHSNHSSSATDRQLGMGSTDPLTRFQRLLLVCLFQRNVHLGNTCLVILLSMCREPTLGVRALQLLRQVRRSQGDVVTFERNREAFVGYVDGLRDVWKRLGDENSSARRTARGGPSEDEREGTPSSRLVREGGRAGGSKSVSPRGQRVSSPGAATAGTASAGGVDGSVSAAPAAAVSAQERDAALALVYGIKSDMRREQSGGFVGFYGYADSPGSLMSGRGGGLGGMGGMGMGWGPPSEGHLGVSSEGAFGGPQEGGTTGLLGSVPGSAQSPPRNMFLETLRKAIAAQSQSAAKEDGPLKSGGAAGSEPKRDVSPSQRKSGGKKRNSGNHRKSGSASASPKASPEAAAAERRGSSASPAKRTTSGGDDAGPSASPEKRAPRGESATGNAPESGEPDGSSSSQQAILAAVCQDFIGSMMKMNEGSKNDAAPESGGTDAAVWKTCHDFMEVVVR